MPRAFGKYQLLERIAVGGMAEIYKAKYFGAAGFEKVMVVKQILPQHAQDPDFVRMFIDEAKIAVSLSHGNIVPVYELGKIDGVYFIAMEYIDGKNLGEILERSADARKPVPTQLALHICMEICKGLDYAHRKTAPDGPLNIVHRDISPQNILVSYDGEVKIVDFGIAKAIYSTAKTKAGIIKGKFGYMSPEQARGVALDSRADIFSTGILLFELLTGSRLFSSESEVETLENVKMAKVPSPSRLNNSIPPMLDKIVFKALAKEPEDRYQNAEDLQKALAKFLYSQGWEVSTNTLATYMGQCFPSETRNRREPIDEPPAPEASTDRFDLNASARPRAASAPADPDGAYVRDDPTRRVPMPRPEPSRPRTPSPVASPASIAPLPPLAPPPRPAPEPTKPALPRESVAGPATATPAIAAPSLIAAARLSSSGSAEPQAILDETANDAKASAPAKPASARPATGAAQEKANTVKDNEAQRPDKAAEPDLGGAEALLMGSVSKPGTSQRAQGAPPSPVFVEPTPEPKRSFAVPVLIVAILALIGVIALLLQKSGVSLSPADKKKKAEEETQRLIVERDKNQPIYGRVEFFIEPEAVDFFWNGQKHPDSPTKHVQISELDIREVYKVRLEVPKKPTEKTMMWYPKEMTITQNDWKVVEGIHINRQNITVDPTPENKEALDKLAEQKKAEEDEAKKEARAKTGGGKKKKKKGGADDE